MSEASVLAGDHHVHSTYSDDARSTLRENLAAAEAIGLRTVRFADHVRTTTTWVPEFVAAVRALPVADGLTVSCAVETKLLDTSGRLDVPRDLVVGPGGVDAVLIADHQFPGEDGALTPSETRELIDSGGLTPHDAVEMVVEGLVAAMLATDRAQLAHPFSILPKVGLDEKLLTDEQLARWGRTAAETGTLVEVNEKWACPGQRAVRAAAKAGAMIVASTDSHVASDVGRYSRAARILSEAGIP
ncbi:PHP domain-containing protein [Humibacter soli]